MTIEERLARLERAVGALATLVTQNFPLRGNRDPLGTEAVQAIAAELFELDAADAKATRRAELEAELAAVT